MTTSDYFWMGDSLCFFEDNLHEYYYFSALGRLITFHMQVRTSIIILAGLALIFSLISLSYNLANNRSIISHQHFSTPFSPYLVAKYQTYEWQIYVIQFGWQIVVIFTELCTLVLFIYPRSRKKQQENFVTGRQWLQLGYIFISVGVVGQTVLMGYGLASVLEIGYENGIKLGDFIVAGLQSVTFAVLLITIAIQTYNFQTLQRTIEKQANKEVIFEQKVGDSASIKEAQTENPNLIARKEIQINHSVQPTINLFKPNFREHTSPMGQHFEQLSHLMEVQPSKRSVKQPLLHQTPLLVSDEHTIPISSNRNPSKLRVHVPRLKLDEMKKKESQKNPLFLLNNLQISAIQPLKQSKVISRLDSSQISDSDISNELDTMKKENTSHFKRK